MPAYVHMDEKEIKDMSLEELIFLLATTLNKGKETKENPELIINVDEVTVLFECEDGRIIDAEEFFSELAFAGIMV